MRILQEASQSIMKGPSWPSWTKTCTLKAAPTTKGTSKKSSRWLKIPWHIALERPWKRKLTSTSMSSRELSRRKEKSQARSLLKTRWLRRIHTGIRGLGTSRRSWSRSERPREPLLRDWDKSHRWATLIRALLVRGRLRLISRLWSRIYGLKADEAIGQAGKSRKYWSVIMKKRRRLIDQSCDWSWFERSVKMTHRAKKLNLCYSNCYLLRLRNSHLCLIMVTLLSQRSHIVSHQKRMVEKSQPARLTAAQRLRLRRALQIQVKCSHRILIQLFVENWRSQIRRSILSLSHQMESHLKANGHHQLYLTNRQWTHPKNRRQNVGVEVQEGPQSNQGLITNSNLASHTRDNQLKRP